MRNDKSQRVATIQDEADAPQWVVIEQNMGNELQQAIATKGEGDESHESQQVTIVQGDKQQQTTIVQGDGPQ